MADEEGWIDFSKDTEAAQQRHGGRRPYQRPEQLPEGGGKSWKGWKNYDEAKWVDYQRWTPNTNNWRARDPREDQSEKTYTSIPNQPEGKTTDDDPIKNNGIPGPIDPNQEQEADNEEEDREDIMRRKEASYAKFRVQRYCPSARARAKSAGPPGARPPGMEVDTIGCFEPLPPLPPPSKARAQQPEKRGYHSASPPPPPPKRKPPPAPPPLSDMPATLKEREGAKLTARGKASLTQESRPRRSRRRPRW